MNPFFRIGSRSLYSAIAKLINLNNKYFVNFTMKNEALPAPLDLYFNNHIGRQMSQLFFFEFFATDILHVVLKENRKN